MIDLLISRFSSLNFQDWKHSFETDECYMQKFASSDVITVQFLSDAYSLPQFILANKDTGNSQSITATELASGVYQFSLTNLEQGIYELKCYNKLGEIIVYSSFVVLPDECLENTSLITYTHYRNQYDVKFNLNDEQIYFDFRVEGGFLYGENRFNVDAESFRSEDSVLTNLSALPYKTKTFTAGRADGVPIWVGEKLNLIFSCTETYVNNKKYVRSEESVPEISEIKQYYPLYVFKIDLEPDDFYSVAKPIYPNGLNLLATPDKSVLLINLQNTSIIVNNK